VFIATTVVYLHNGCGGTSWGTMEIISTIEGVKFWDLLALNCGYGRELVGNNLPE